MMFGVYKVHILYVFVFPVYNFDIFGRVKETRELSTGSRRRHVARSISQEVVNRRCLALVVIRGGFSTSQRRLWFREPADG